MAKKTQKQERINDILLGPLERPALQWLAKHMPKWVTPDILTGVGIFASVLIFVSYALVGRGETLHNGLLWLASFGFVLNWFGDSLDGTLARYRHIERPRFGYFIDHSVDAFSAVAIFMGLGLSGLTTPLVGALATIGYLLAMITVYLKTFVTGTFEMTSMKLGPTEIRLLAILINSLIFFIGNPIITLPVWGQVKLFTILLSAIAAFLFVYFIYRTIVEGMRLALLDGKRLERRLEREAAKAEKGQHKQELKSKKAK